MVILKAYELEARVRGGATVDANWQNGKLQQIVIKSHPNSRFKIKIPEYVTKVQANGNTLKIENQMVQIPF